MTSETTTISCSEAAEAAAAHAELSKIAQYLRRALLARTELSTAPDQPPLRSEQIAAGVQILHDLVSIEKTLLTNQFLAAELADRRAAAAKSSPAPKPQPPAGDSTPLRFPMHHQLTAPLLLSPIPPAQSLLSTGTFPAHLDAFPSTRSWRPWRLGALDSCPTPTPAATPTSKRAFASAPLSSCPHVSVNAVPACPTLTLTSLASILSSMPARLNQFSAMLAPESFHNSAPDYSQPAPGYNPPRNDAFPPGTPPPSIRRDRANPGHYCYYFPRRSSRDTS